ncbi:MAG TPA: methyltransferase domain-containing protein [Candidatus Binatia bacterium]|jgi:tRNA (cmo5U34)-methyltransferase
MDLKLVRDHFEQEAMEYDSSILRLVPHYHEQHEIILQLLPFETELPLQILDLGCGTGVLSHVLLRAFPKAKVVACDLAANMLETTRKNLAAYHDRVELRQADFGKADLGSGYDLIVSGLAIHHLDDAGKRSLYHRLFNALKPAGMFLNREIVIGATPSLTKVYEQWWRDFVKANGESDETWFQKYFEEDLPASVEDQLKWLSDAGFIDVACHWRYINFAIFGGKKPG